MSCSGGEVANLVQVAEDHFPCLFADDRVKAEREELDFLAEAVVQEREE